MKVTRQGEHRDHRSLSHTRRPGDDAMMHRPVHGQFLLGDGPEVAAMAAKRFRADPAGWLPPPATPIIGGHRVVLSMATALPTPDVAAIVSVGALVDPMSGLALRSLAWKAETADDLLPVLRGDLELHVCLHTTLRLIGSYTPPLSVLGAVTDQVVGRHMAKEVVRGFVTTVARRLSTSRHGRTGRPNISTHALHRSAVRSSRRRPPCRHVTGPAATTLALRQSPGGKRACGRVGP